MRHFQFNTRGTIMSEPNDYERYMRHLMANEVEACLRIEERYGVDGLDPGTCARVIDRVCNNGEDPGKVLDDLMGA